MPQYIDWYAFNNKGFFKRREEWTNRNCVNCPFINMKEHMKNEEDFGFCWAEVDQNILSRKPRLMLYIFLYYERRLNGVDCLLKSAILDR